MSQEKEILLHPSHKAIIWWYLLGILLIPFFGLGFILLYRFYKTHRSIWYTITESTIQVNDSKFVETVDIANIREANAVSRWTDNKFGIGDIIIQTETRTVRLIGQENPKQLANMIVKAAIAERKRIASFKKRPKPEVESSPKNYDKLDYLTGLWQQGLLSDEDFRKEKKHFE
jgi:hypothetical protein